MGALVNLGMVMSIVRLLLTVPPRAIRAPIVFLFLEPFEQEVKAPKPG